MSIDIFITNLGKYVEGALIGQWVKLPISDDTLADILKQIGIGERYEEYFITDYESSLCGLQEVIGEYTSIKALNKLAESIETLSRFDEDKLGAVLECESCHAVCDIIDIIDHLEDFDLLSDIDSDEELGRYYIEDCEIFEVPSYLKNYVDYERFGRDVRLENNIIYTSFGCLVDNR